MRDLFIMLILCGTVTGFMAVILVPLWLFAKPLGLDLKFSQVLKTLGLVILLFIAGALVTYVIVGIGEFTSTLYKKE